jgi:hypothetical protein
MRYLESRSVTSPFFSMGLLDDVDRKASFAVNESGYPPYLDQSFLLIVRN